MKKAILTAFIALAILLSLSTVCAADGEYDGYIVKLKDKPASVSLFGTKGGVNDLAADTDIINGELDLFVVESLDDIPPYISEDDIEYIEPNYKVTLFEMPNDSLFQEYQGNLRLINAPAFWESGCYGQGIKVGVIDSGAYAHIDLAANLLEGYNFINNNTNVTDDTGHGTAVSGIIAAVGNNAQLLTGLAYRAKIVPLKCFDNNQAYFFEIATAIRQAVDTYGCKIINMSFGSIYNSETLMNAVNYALSKDVIVVAACGNDGNGKVNYPAAYPGVVGVGSVDGFKIWSTFSNQNESVDVVAQGEDMCVLDYKSNRDDKNQRGTSFSAPQVSAMAALCLNIKPDMTPNEFYELLTRTCDDLGEAGRDNTYGWGLLNAENILNDLLGDKEYFVAPFDFEAENPSAVVYNNTSSPLEALSFFKGDSLIAARRISAEPKSGVHISADAAEGEFKHYLWSLNLRPLEKSVFIAPAAKSEN